VFYRAIGFVVWKLALKYLRQRLGKPAAALTVAAAIGVIYVATRDK
jgi:hypothetical protein